MEKTLFYMWPTLKYQIVVFFCVAALWGEEYPIMNKEFSMSKEKQYFVIGYSLFFIVYSIVPCGDSSINCRCTMSYDYLRNGLCFFSFFIDVEEPWPGYILVSPGNVKTFSLIEFSIWLWFPPGRSVRPIDSQNSVSPLKSIPSFLK